MERSEETFFKKNVDFNFFLGWTCFQLDIDGRFRSENGPHKKIFENWCTKPNTVVTILRKIKNNEIVWKYDQPIETGYQLEMEP